MRTLAIGDIHGSSTLLDALLAAVAPTARDNLVFLGDYVDRGPDTKGVLDRLIALKETVPCVFLLGNHELMMMRARDDAGTRKMWQQVGGRQALASYAPRQGAAGDLSDIPTTHWDFLKQDCVDFAETPTHVFVHAGLDPTQPLDRQTEEHLFWNFLDLPFGLEDGRTVICGHTSQKSGEILDLGDTICLDTYAYGGGKLTCLDVDARHFWQVDALGRVTEGDLG